MLCFITSKFVSCVTRFPRMRLSFFARRRRRAKSVTVLPIDWERMTIWLSDMEDCLPEGVYLQVCDLTKQLHSAQTLHDQRYLIDELIRSNDGQWMFAKRNSLCC